MVVPRGHRIKYISIMVVIYSCGGVVANKGCNVVAMFIISGGLVIVDIDMFHNFP